MNGIRAPRFLSVLVLMTVLLGVGCTGGSRDAAPEPLKILILGGTGFIGPWEVETALARGHEVTLFNRGKSKPDVFDPVTILTERLRALRGGEDEAAEAPETAETPEIPPAPDPIERSDFGETVFVEPGGLLEVVA